MSTSRGKKGAVFSDQVAMRNIPATMTRSKRGGQNMTLLDNRTRKVTHTIGVSRGGMSSTSKKNTLIKISSERMMATRPAVQVYDDQGQDVTPLPLLNSGIRKNQTFSGVDSSSGTTPDHMSQTSIYQTGTVTASTFGGGPFMRSVFSGSQSGRSMGSIACDIEHTGELPASITEIKHRREDVKELLTDKDLERTIEIELKETETIWLLDMPGVCVSNENDDAAFVKTQNERYRDLVKSRVGNDRYAERGMNTFNDPPKLKSVQTIKVTHSDVGINATNWDMFDTYELVAKREAAAKEEEEQDELGEESMRDSDTKLPDINTASNSRSHLPTTIITSESDVNEKKPSVSVQSDGAPSKNLEVSTEVISANLISSVGGSESLFGSRDPGGLTENEEIRLSEEELMMKSESLNKNLVIMERVINLNNYQPKQALYRALPIVEDIDSVRPTEEHQSTLKICDMGPNLDRLWSYSCPLTKGCNVSCMAWNKINVDLLAVGYGEFDFTNQKGGKVCCWSLKNPEHPERHYTCASGVTAMDYSVAHPNLLAVGLYDGTVAIYNVRSENNETVLDSLKDLRTELQYESSGKHTGPVWQLKWIEKERGSGEERTEVLVSISQDGRVTQWSIRKGFESYDLMKLKRVAAKQAQGKVKKGEAFISRFAGGLCFDFSSKDPNIYLAGTEEGHIHKCSCSYNEQYLDSYLSHTGPVYAIQWSPFNPDLFLSCSADWTIKLWHQDHRLRPILHFHSSTKAVPDVCWSPRSSTVFACVNEGSVEVWDLSQNTLDPIIELVPLEGIKLSSLVFATNSDCILVGDSNGEVNVYQLRCMPPTGKTNTQQLEALNKVIKASLASQIHK